MNSRSKKRRRTETTTDRRVSHNASEARRANRINEAISELRTLLSQAGRLEKQDKGSVLEACVAALKQMQISEDAMVPVARPLRAPPSLPSGSAPFDLRSAPVDYRSLFTHSAVAMVVTTTDLVYLDYNEQFLIMTGYAADELRSCSMFRLTPEADKPKLWGMIREIASKPPSQSTRIKIRKLCHFKDGVTVIELLVRPIVGTDGTTRLHCTVLPGACERLPPGEPAVSRSESLIVGPTAQAPLDRFLALDEDTPPFEEPLLISEEDGDRLLMEISEQDGLNLPPLFDAMEFLNEEK